MYRTPRHFAMLLTVLGLAGGLTVTSFAAAPPAAAVSAVTLSPTSGPPGTSVTGSGTDWRAGDHIQVYWGGAALGAQVPVDGSGSFKATFVVPAGAALGDHNVSFNDIESRYFIVAVFHVATVEVTQALTGDGDNRARDSFTTGSTVHYLYAINNHASTDVKATITVRASGPAELFSSTFDFTLKPGTSYIYTPQIIPDNATSGTYQMSVNVSVGGASILKSASFSVAQGAPIALSVPFSPGVHFRVITGYHNRPEAGCVIGIIGHDHCNNQLFGLDFQPTSSDPTAAVLAPLPGTVYWIYANSTGQPVGPACMGIRLGSDRLSSRLNLTVCHFSSYAVKVGQSVARGQRLGTRGTSWVHLSLDNRGANGNTRPFLPVPFNEAGGGHTFNTYSLNPNHLGGGDTVNFGGKSWVVNADEWVGLHW